MFQSHQEKYNTYLCMCTCVHTCMSLSTYIFKHTCIYAANIHICAWTHTHVCTHKHCFRAAVSFGAGESVEPTDYSQHKSLWTRRCQHSSSIPQQITVLFHSYKASNCVVFRPETNWMNPRPLKGQYALLGQKFHKFISSRNTLTHTQISFLSTAKTWFGLPNGHTKLVIILHIRIFC